tara:strand:- start:454 stop:657 length:204 start_codon:yes stop_codon:yes gene_type:complete
MENITKEEIESLVRIEPKLFYNLSQGRVKYVDHPKYGTRITVLESLYVPTREMTEEEQKEFIGLGKY